MLRLTTINPHFYCVGDQKSNFVRILYSIETILQPLLIKVLHEVPIQIFDMAAAFDARFGRRAAGACAE